MILFVSQKPMLVKYFEPNVSYKKTCNILGTLDMRFAYSDFCFTMNNILQKYTVNDLLSHPLMNKPP